MSLQKIFNTGETQEELKLKHNPEGSILRRAQYRMLDMLLYLDKLCKEQNIKWSLEGGNVLGAVRHGGFIPWDDDVDIIMERKEYNKLKKYLLSHPHPQFVLQTHKTDPGYYGSWMVLRDLKSEYIQDCHIHNARKYRGMQIDIFPIEIGYFDFFHKIAAKIHFINANYFIGKYHSIANLCYHFEQDILCPFFRLISRLFGKKNRFSYEYGHGSWPKFEYKFVFPLSSINFEGHNFPSPNNVDAYLKSLYGENYMNLPSINKRNHHQATYRIYE